MRKILVFAVILTLIGLSGLSYAQGSQPFGGKLKIQGYGEYISYSKDDIDADAWGGGVLARYLFLNWLGAQTNVSFYSDAESDRLEGNLSATNWRLSAILHGYLSAISSDMPENPYIYAGGGLGVQFSDDVGSIEIDDTITGHVLGGIGYDLTDILNIEVEVGYQFGDADVTNFQDDKIDLDAVFVRLGGGIRF